MTILSLFGSLLVTFSPIIAIFYFVVSRHARLIILSVGSAFFWLLAALLSGLLWYLIPPLRDFSWFIIPSTVLLQEAFRFVFFLLFKKAEKGFGSQIKSKEEILQIGASMGVGIALIHALINHVTILTYSIGPASFFNKDCPSISIFFFSSIIECFFTLLNVFWSILSYYGFAEKSYLFNGFTVLSHFIASFLTLTRCWLQVILIFVLTVIIGLCSTIALGWEVTGRTSRK